MTLLGLIARRGRIEKANSEDFVIWVIFCIDDLSKDVILGRINFAEVTTAMNRLVRTRRQATKGKAIKARDIKGGQMYITNMSATDGGVNSKVSLFQAPFPGLPLH